MSKRRLPVSEDEVRRAVEPFHGVVTREQLLASGLPRSFIDRAIREGVLVPLLNGVFVLASAEITSETWELARLRYVDRQMRRKWDGEAPRPTAAITGTAAALLHDIPHLDRDPRTTVIATNPASRCEVEDVLLVPRQHLAATDIEVIRGITVTNLVWTVIELLVVLLRSHSINIVADLARCGRLSIDELRAAAARVPEAADHVMAVLAHLTPEDLRARSDAERRLLALIRRHGLPVPDVNRLVQTALHVLEVDFAWPEVRLVVELDGPHHDEPGQKAIDQARDAALREMGWEVVRIRVDELDADPDAVIERIARALAERSLHV